MEAQSGTRDKNSEDMGKDEAQAGGEGRGAEVEEGRRGRGGGSVSNGTWEGEEAEEEISGKREAGEEKEKGRDAKEVRNGEFLSPKGVEGMKVVV